MDLLIPDQSPYCRQHPWFRLHLPRYLAVMQADTVATSTHVDDDVVDEVVRLGFSRGEVAESVKSRSQNKVSLRWYIPVLSVLLLPAVA